MPISLTQLNVDEALRYMGCPPEKADPATRGPPGYLISYRRRGAYASPAACCCRGRT